MNAKRIPKTFKIGQAWIVSKIGLHVQLYIDILDYNPPYIKSDITCNPGPMLKFCQSGENSPNLVTLFKPRRSEEYFILDIFDLIQPHAAAAVVVVVVVVTSLYPDRIMVGSIKDLARYGSIL